MIPGKRTCPSSWTKEYSGYLMADFYDHKHNSVYECIDEEMDGISNNGSATSKGARMYHVIVSCGSGHGLPCPPYEQNKSLTCVVCTKWALLPDNNYNFLWQSLYKFHVKFFFF